MEHLIRTFFLHLTTDKSEKLFQNLYFFRMNGQFVDIRSTAGYDPNRPREVLKSTFLELILKLTI